MTRNNGRRIRRCRALPTRPEGSARCLPDQASRPRPPRTKPSQCRKQPGRKPAEQRCVSYLKLRSTPTRYETASQMKGSTSENETVPFLVSFSPSSKRVPNAGRPHGIDTGTRSHAAAQHQAWHVDINVFPDAVNATVKFGRSGRIRGRGVTESSRS